MRFLLCLFLILGSTQPLNDMVIEDFVHVIEINHCYDEQTRFRFDQIIFWEYVYDPTDGIIKEKVVFAFLLNPKLNREQLTQEEMLRKNREVGDKWVKEHGFKFGIPQYEPTFYGSYKCPVKVGKYWRVIFSLNHKIFVIKSISCFETWTLFDREADNQSWFPRQTRRGIPGIHGTLFKYF